MKRASSFGKALQLMRKSKGYPQEAFDQVSSRTYVSTVERGLKHPTLPKIDSFAKVLDTHPLTLLTLSYLDLRDGPSSLDEMLARIRQEVEQALDTAKGAVRPPPVAKS